jgi:hypothetical protein
VGDVPWESLNAGDTVLIYHRATPYKEKFVLSRVGTPSAPITVRGVLGPLGERPVLDGNGATTRPQLDHYSRNRGVIKIGGSTVPFADGITVMPQWIVIENLDILVEGNYIYDNGNTGSNFEHNVYTNKFRKGTLYFYNNTVVSDRTDRTRLFRLTTNDEACDARNNIASRARRGRTTTWPRDRPPSIRARRSISPSCRRTTW